MILRVDAVPGWVLDHVVGESADHVLVAARRAAVLGPGEVPEYATFRFPRVAEIDTVMAAPPVLAPRADHPSEAPRPPARPRRTLASVGVAATLVLVVGLVGLARPRSSAADVEPRVVWDTDTATATLDTPAGPTTFRVGAPGDQLVVGDWWGGGRATAVLYRPTTGERWLFETWAGPEDDVAPRPLAPAPAHGTLQVQRIAGRDVPVIDVP